jgi:malonyl-CoA O-methyltransferase
MNLCRQNSIADSFSRAAATYDEYACVQKKTARHLAELLPLEREIGSILETGCGTGFYSMLLSEAFPQAEIFSLDLSFNMAAMAAGRLKDIHNIHLMAADAEQIPFNPETTFDLITSNGALQWFSSLETALESLRKLLGPGGTLLVSFFGNRTLEELACAVRSEIREDARIAAEAFPAADEAYDIFRRVFSKVEFAQRTVARTYPNLPAMLRALKMTGVVPAGNAPILRTRGDMEKIEKNYLQKAGRVTASYQVIIVRAEK